MVVEGGTKKVRIPSLYWTSGTIFWSSLKSIDFLSTTSTIFAAASTTTTLATEPPPKPVWPVPAEEISVPGSGKIPRIKFRPCSAFCRTCSASSRRRCRPWKPSCRQWTWSTSRHHSCGITSSRAIASHELLERQSLQGQRSIHFKKAGPRIHTITKIKDLLDELR